jgi:UDP-N-acetylglucosamine--N-acetylmuramyl-(pentapeptide) pyrophosphoryl-undecaprenol N-acetylglucosamine transferase
VLIPFPYAAGDHQRHNALALEDAGAALCVPQERATAGRLAELVSGLLHDPFRLKTMAAAATAFGRPRAARDVAEDVIRLAGLHAPSAADTSHALRAAAEEVQ